MGFSGAARAKTKLLQFFLHGVIQRGFCVHLGGLVTFHFQRCRYDFPAHFPAVNLKAMFNQFAALFLSANDGDEDPFILLESLECLHFAVGNRDGLGMVIDGLSPRLRGHGLASVVEQDTELVGGNSGVHDPILTETAPRESIAIL
jgi:hypothetical protein